MKTLGPIAIIFAVVFLTGAIIVLTCGGCAVTKVETPEWKFATYRLFYGTEIPKITKGDLIVEGYKGKSDPESITASASAIGTIAGSMAKTAIK
jgi:hypothetical protein